MKEWHFFEKVYRVWVVVLISEPAEFYQFMKDAGYNDLTYLKQGSTTGWLISMNSENNTMGNDCYIMWLHKFESGCLVHEITHLAMSVFEDKGVPIRAENTEAFAYYCEYWFNEINRTRRRLPNGRTAKQTKRL